MIPLITPGTGELTALAALAAAIGLVHTLAGPDHYVPFIAMAKIGRWTYRRTMLVSFLCGLGHVLGSVLLGTIGVAAGVAVAGLESFEGLRGNLAAWLLLGFGLAYVAWGLKHAGRSGRHAHVHRHADGTVHSHEHAHHGEHTHAHDDRAGSFTPWVLFIVFILGPCEPLIPLLMYPAAKQSVGGLLLVTAIFAATTLGTILLLVTIGHFGLARVGPGPMAKFSHVLAGLALAACGSAMIFGL